MRKNLCISNYCRIFASEKETNNKLNPKTRKGTEIMKKQILEQNLTRVAGVAVEITFARTNLVTFAWEGNHQSAFDKLQSYFKGLLFDYEYDEECDYSVCCLSI